MFLPLTSLQKPFQTTGTAPGLGMEQGKPAYFKENLKDTFAGTVLMATWKVNVKRLLRLLIN